MVPWDPSFWKTPESLSESASSIDGAVYQAAPAAMRRYTGARRPGVNQHVTALITREGRWFVSFCPDYDVASQGKTVEEAKANLTEALELFFETADASEIERRRRGEVYVTQLDVAVG
jgi:predicted RNase H-like HicB family nuclease